MLSYPRLAVEVSLCFQPRSGTAASSFVLLPDIGRKVSQPPLSLIVFVQSGAQNPLCKTSITVLPSPASERILPPVADLFCPKRQLAAEPKINISEISRHDWLPPEMSFPDEARGSQTLNHHSSHTRHTHSLPELQP